MRKIYSLIVLGLLLLFVTACNNKNNLNDNIPVTKAIKSFVFVTDDAEYHAVVNNEAASITASGIMQGSKIKKVKVELSDGYTIQPDPNTITKWKNNQTFYIRGMENQTEYNCYLPDLLEILDKDFVVMGYIRTEQRSFDDIFPTIDLGKVTHVIASFAHANSDGTLDISGVDKNINKLMQAAHEKKVKVMISVNKAGNGEFAAALQTAEKRTVLVEQILNYVVSKGLDGFDIDFEDYSYLNNAEFREKLKEFAKELYEKKPEGMIMTCAVSPIQQYPWGYGDYFDYVNIMNYDTFSGRQHASYESYVNQINNMHNKIGTPFSKLVGGLPFYGYSWDNIPGRDANGAISFGSILNAYKEQGAADKDNVNETYYNGRPTIRKKCQYAKENGLPGVMIWDLLLDTQEEEYKLLNVVAEEMLFNKQ